MKISFLAAVLGSCALVVQGGPVFTQPIQGGFSYAISSTLNNFQQAPGYQAFDDFTLSSSAAINVVKWWGVPVGGDSFFSITFYAGGTTPGATLATYLSSPTIQPTGAGPENVYTAFLPTDFNAVSGAQYWMSIFNLRDNASWGWSSSDPGNGKQLMLVFGSDYIEWGRNLAFSLGSESIYGT